MSPRPLRPLSAQRIAALLGLGPDAIHALRRQGGLIPLGQFGGAEHPEYRFSPEEVNRLLERTSHGFRTPPTIEALARGEICLISSSEVSELTGKSPERVNKYAANGCFAWIQLHQGSRGSFRRFCKKSVEEYLENKKKELFTLAQTAKVLGAGAHQTVLKLIERGELQDVYSDARDGLNRHFILPDSLRQVIQARLVPNDDTADAWIEDCLDDERRLFTSPDVMQELGLGRRPVLRLADSGVLRHIVRSGVRLFLPVSVDAYREQQARLNVAELARLLGVTHTSIYSWRQSGLLASELRHTCEDGWCRGCVVALLRRWLSSDDVLPTELFEGRMSGRIQLWTTRDACRHLGCSEYKISEYIQEGRLVAIALPGGSSRVVWRIITTQ